MASLRDRWHRNPVYHYFALMEPIDRATALIVLALLLAWAVAFAAIVRHREPSISSAPRLIGPSLTAPPFTMDFAATWPAVPG